MSYQFGHVDRDERIEFAADEPLAETARRGGLPGPLVTALVMAVFAGALWIAYDLGAHRGAAPHAAAGAVPLIHADTRPMKVKPDQPGGMAVPGRDRLIYNERPGGPPVEKLLPPPEQPAPRPAPDAAVASAALAEPPQLPATAVPAPPPRKPLPPARGEAAAQPHSPLPRPHLGLAAAAALPESAPGPVRVQLATLRSVDAARLEWQRLKRENPDLLGQISADAVRSDRGDGGTYYRIVAGSFVHVAAAERLCRALQERHLGCSIVR